VSPVTRASGERRTVAFRFGCDRRLRQAVCVLANATRPRHPWARAVYERARARGCDHPHACASSAAPWLGNALASVRLIDLLENDIDAVRRQLRQIGADHPTCPCCARAPASTGFWASPSPPRFGDIARFASPAKLIGYAGLCPSL
jgi:hypothetical protein